jgi:hypothetical protein
MGRSPLPAPAEGNNAGPSLFRTTAARKPRTVCRLPAGRLHDGGDGYAIRTAQQRRRRLLLRAMCLILNGGLCPLCFRPALRSRPRLCARPALGLGHFRSSRGRRALSRCTTTTPRRPAGAGGGEELGPISIGPPSATTDAPFADDVERK